MSHLWSTLRVGTSTEREQVITWLQRAYPKKVVIDTHRDRQIPSDTLPFAALQEAFASASQWHELIISSFPSENMADQLGFQLAIPMNVLRSLHVEAGCVNSPSFIQLLDLIPTEAPLSELGLYSSFAITYFLQPHRFPILRNITVLIVNGRDFHEPFDVLPVFTRLHTFEADRLPIPWYGLNIKFPLLRTLRKMQLRASSVQWMAGKRFLCLEECIILLPRHGEALQLHGSQFPSCTKFTYCGYPMSTFQYFHVPRMRAMDLRSYDCREQRVSQQLHHLCTVDGRISKLTTLHLTLQCSEQAFIKMLDYLGLLKELIVSISHRSPSWETFLELLIAKPSRDDWPNWSLKEISHQKWDEWCSSQTWHTNLLPQLTYLGVRCPKGFYQSECLYSCPLLRLVGWTRKRLTPPLEHLKVWEGRGTTDDIVVDYISIGYLDRHPELSSDYYDSMIIRGMVTRRLLVRDPVNPLFQFPSAILFRQLHDLEIDHYHDNEITILPFLERIKKLDIWHGIIPAYSSDIDLPLVQTLQWLRLCHSTLSWMLGRTFKALRDFHINDLRDTLEIQSRHEALQVDLPACTTLRLWNFPVNHLHLLSCPNVHILQWAKFLELPAIDAAALNSLRIFFYTCSYLQKLDILIPHHLEREPLIRFVFCDAMEQGVWRHIMSVEVKVLFRGSSRKDRHHFFSQIIGHQRDFDKSWKEFTITQNGFNMMVTVGASMLTVSETGISR